MLCAMAIQQAQKARTAQPPATPAHSFTFLTNHAHVLICLARDSDLTLRQVAIRVGITERAVLAIVRDLGAAGVIAIQKQGRKNQYRINTRMHLRHPVEMDHTIGELLKALG